MTFRNSLVMIAPAALMPTLTALGPSIGFSEGEFSVPLSATGTDPATHYGLHAWSRDDFVETITSAATIGELDEATTAALRAALIISNRIGGEPYEHWTAVLTANGLQVIQPPLFE
jgi:hypothetical protein